MTQLSHNAEMARRVLAMTIGLPIDSDPGLREDTFWLTGISDILVAGNCYKDVEREMQEMDTLNKRCHPTPEECIEALKWVLEKTDDPIRFLHILSSQHTLYFLQDGDKTVGLFEGNKLAFYEDYIGKRSAYQRLQLAEEAVRLAEKTEVRLDLLHFAREVLQGIKYDLNCPADHRRNLIVGSLETILDDDDRKTPPDRRRVSTKDVRFGIDQMLGKLPFPPSFRARLDALRKKGDERSESEIIREALKLYEALQNPDAVIVPKQKPSGEQ